MTSYAVFIPHGGGPLPLLGDPGHAGMVTALKALAKRLPKPKTIIVISAHWESPTIAITHSAKPQLYYDYYGFPAESYQIQYPCAGEAELAARISNQLKTLGISSTLENERGLDHGVFVPLKIMYPTADIPVLQISLHNSLDAATHIALGKALASCKLTDTLFLGSGFSFHNMRAFFGQQPDSVRQGNQAFEDWIEETFSPRFAPQDIEQRLTNWQLAPAARLCQPREEHLLPLHVCYGIAEKCADRYERVTVLDKQAALIEWQLEY